jgi:hypothetical protein
LKNVNGTLFRKCCFPTLQEPLEQALVVLLSHVIEETINFKMSKEYSKLSRSEKENFNSFCKLLVEEVVPFLSGCFSALFYSSRRLITNDKLPQLEQLTQWYEKSNNIQTISSNINNEQQQQQQQQQETTS